MLVAYLGWDSLNVIASTQAAWSKVAATSGQAPPVKAPLLQVQCITHLRMMLLWHHGDPCPHCVLNDRMADVPAHGIRNLADPAQAPMWRKLRPCAPCWEQPRLLQREDLLLLQVRAAAQRQLRLPRMLAAQLRCVSTFRTTLYSLVHLMSRMQEMSSLGGSNRSPLGGCKLWAGLSQLNAGRH